MSKKVIRETMHKLKHDFTLKEWLLITAAYVAVDLIVSWLFYNSLKAAVIFIPGYLLFARAAAYWLKERKRRQLKQEFRTFMMMLYSMISAGESLESAIEDALHELEHMGEAKLCVKELRLIVSKLNMNYSIIRCLDDFSDRIRDEDITDFCEIMKLAKEKGGSMKRIVRNSIERINEKIEMECEIDTIISGKKHEFLIMACIPFGMILYMRAGSPELTEVLYVQLAGRLIMTAGLAVYILAIYIGIKMTDIKA